MTVDLLERLRETDPALYEIESKGIDRVDPPPGWEDEFLAKLDDSKMKVSPVSANCNTKYRAIHESGTRKLSDIRWIVVHDEEGLTAVGAANWFRDPRSGGSAQLCVDAGSCYRTLPDNVIPWAAPLANFNGWHIELAGMAAWTRAQWLAHHGTIYRAAYKCEYHARKFDIPLRWLTDKQLAGRTAKGFITHRQITRVFGSGTHTDPGSHFPGDVFMRDVRAFAAT